MCSKILSSSLHSLISKMKEETQNSIKRTADLIDKFGPRLTTSEPCNQTANELYHELKENCDSAYNEEFLTQPGGITNILNWMSVLFYLGVAAFWLNLPQISFMFALLSIVIFFFEFVLYYHVIDRFYPNHAAHNVYGVIEPREQVKNIVIFSGHHDSQHIFNFYCDYPSLYLVREVIFILINLTFMVWQGYFTFQKILSGTLFLYEVPTGLYTKVRYFYTFCILFTIPIWSYLNEKGTPGAGDNLISSSMAVELSNYYRKHKDSLKHTKLYFVSFDAEEIALRGSRAFFQRHKKEFNEVKTWHFNVDCPYYIDHLRFLKTDINGLRKLSERLATKCVSISKELGYKNARTEDLMFLTGGTDAAEAASVGIESTTLLGIPFSPKNSKGERVVYHQPEDTIDHVEPEIVEATLSIFTKFVEEVDNGNFP